MEQGIYPLKFLPLFKQRVWGGNKIATELGVDYSPLPSCGELWCLSGLREQETVVANGFLAEAVLEEVIEMYTDELLGEENYAEFGTDFPLLLKIIDANDNLSVQVHPDDDYAERNGLGNGKNEMWYVLQADKDAQLFNGWNKNMTKTEVINRVRENNLIEVLNCERVERGDLFYIPAGLVHSLGKGCMVAEVQQSSDTTYRLYDWGRVDENGKSRTLHMEEALQVLDLKGQNRSGKVHYHYNPDKTNNMLTTPFFTVNHIHCFQGLKKDYSALDSFVIYFCVGGGGFIETESGRIPMRAGEAMLIPAVCQATFIQPQPNMEILEIFIV